MLQPENRNLQVLVKEDQSTKRINVHADTEHISRDEQVIIIGSYHIKPQNLHALGYQ